MQHLACLIAVVALYPSTALQADITFEPVPESQTGLGTAVENWRGGRTGGDWWPWAVTAWDQDGDGRLDLIVTCHSGAGSRIFRQADGLQFVDVTDSLGLKSDQLPREGRPVVFDVDGDGRADLAPSIMETLPLVWNRGDKLELGPDVSGLRGGRGGELVDLDGDGRLDWLQFTRRYGKTTRTQFLNTGKGLARSSARLALPEDLPAAVRARLEALEREDPAVTPNYQGPNTYGGPVFDRRDINGDGREDCACQYFADYGVPSRTFGVYLYRDAKGDLADVTETCGVPGHLTPLLPLRDLSGDGRPDVLAAFGAGAGLYVQRPDGTFELRKNERLAAVLTPTTGTYLYGVRHVDFDRDGDDDLVVTQHRLGVLEVYENKGEGEYVRVLRASHWDAEGFDVADLNGDGLPDLVTGNGPGDVTVWLNKTVAGGKGTGN